MSPFNWFKKNEPENDGCPFGIDNYNENCKLRNCNKISTCQNKSINFKSPIEQPSVKGQNSEVQDDDKASTDPVIDFYRKPGTYEINQRRVSKPDRLEKSNSLKCSQCGRQFLKIQSVNAYKCHRCGKVFCSTHHLPQNHKCSGKRSWNPFSGIFRHV